MGNRAMKIRKVRDATVSRLSAFATLLVLMIAGIILVPMLNASAPELRAERILGPLVLLAVLWAAGVRPARLLWFVPVVAAHVILLHSGGTYGRLAAIGVRAIFFAVAIGLIGLHVLREHRVTGDTIAGAACIYTLIGLLWGNLYEIVFMLSPAAFDIPTGFLTGPSGDTTVALQIFSFITLTTVGYGDIHPATPMAGGLAVAEAIVGQLYVATMIARLVGLQLIQEPDKSD
jgi:hypothetical protein